MIVLLSLIDVCITSLLLLLLYCCCVFIGGYSFQGLGQQPQNPGQLQSNAFLRTIAFDQIRYICRKKNTTVKEILRNFAADVRSHSCAKPSSGGSPLGPIFVGRWVRKKSNSGRIEMTVVNDLLDINQVIYIFFKVNIHLYRSHNYFHLTNLTLKRRISQPNKKN